MLNNVAEWLGARTTESCSGPTNKLLRQVAASGAILIAGLSCIILFGWFADMPFLTGFRGQSTSVATAACFILSAVAIFSEARFVTVPSWFGRGLATIVLLVACFDIWTFAQHDPLAGYLMGPDFGSMSSGTATCFVLLSVAIMAGRAGHGYFEGIVIAVGLMLAMVDVVCQVYGVQALYALQPFAAMSLYTSIYFLVLFVCFLLANPERGWTIYLTAGDNGGTVARVLLPAIILIPFALCWVVMIAVDREHAFDSPFGFALVAVATTFIFGIFLCLTSAALSRSDSILRQVNKSLQESESAARGVINTALDAFIQIDDCGRVTEWNPQAETVFGWTREDALGRNLADLIVPEDFRAAHNAGLARFLRTKKAMHTGDGIRLGGRVELPAATKSGEMLSIELAVTTLTRAGRQYFNAFIRDITERKMAEEQRQLLTDKLVTSNDELRHFTYVASHDMQEHLRMVLAFGTLLSERYGPQLDDTARQYIATSHTAAMRMRELVDDLLIFGRVGAEGREAADFDASAEMKLVLEGLQDPIRESGAEITIAPLPHLWGNHIRFRQLMQNLIANAIKYVAPHTQPVIDITVEDTGDFWQFCVKDNGIGIEPRHHEQIFEPFKRLDTKAEYYGTGLGLAICKRIVTDTGGEIWVKSEPGTGTAFYFTIKKTDQEK